jgi:hypothetical protein
MRSVRDALNAVGRAISIKQSAHQANAPFPLSLRDFVKAPPPGRIHRKEISLDLLQRKLDKFLNKRGPPPFLTRLNGTHYGASTVRMTFGDPAKDKGLLHAMCSRVRVLRNHETLGEPS